MNIRFKKWGLTVKVGPSFRRLILSISLIRFFLPTLLPANLGIDDGGGGGGQQQSQEAATGWSSYLGLWSN